MLKRFFQSYIRTVQKLLAFILLAFVYVVGFGITRLFTFASRGRRPAKSGNEGSFWVDASGYEADMAKARVQS